MEIYNGCKVSVGSYDHEIIGSGGDYVEINTPGVTAFPRPRTKFSLVVINDIIMQVWIQFFKDRT